MNKNSILEVWGYKTYRPFRIYWVLHEFNLSFESNKIGSRTGETQTKKYLKMNPKGKIPLLRHNDKIITESAAAVNYITYTFKQPKDFFIPKSSYEKAKVDEWCAFSLMELDCLAIYTLRLYEKPQNFGLSNLYGNASNAVKTARKHFDRMIKACEDNIPKEKWLFGESPSVADILFVSCLLASEKFNLKIKSDKVLHYLNRAKKREQFLKAFEDCFY